jgi:hypothetical protein
MEPGLSRKRRKAKRRAEADAYAKDARFWAKVPKSALSVDDHRTPISRDAAKAVRPFKRRYYI